ncbi:hypothetical protein CONLIGDRAFT_358076 [Coniochaeta ligniaria NRRL 30616]|uniref:Uncharacterized protein n=1 Tax=Coniochaeta ligniaria NRRL 30616 TaxID=1408157 RepID=A0A1J7IRL9_9PEZI|nr:hypothetical protein CONLIGDRAFT_358076 [Coniochaeta ligniaria NRRL 30616]
MATPVQNMVSKFSTTTSSHSSTASTLFDKLAYLEKFRDEPRQRWISIATLVMLITQTLAATGGLILSGLVFGDKFAVVGQCASQSFVLFASILAVPYVTLHLRAAKTNFSIIRSQSFQHPLHSWTIIVARLAFLAWTVAVIASSVAVARASGDKVHLQLDLFFCVTAFLAMTFCLAVVEKAAEPFILPWFSPSRSVVCRISSFGSFIDDSVSRRGSTGSGKQQMSEKPVSDRPMPSGPRPLEIPTSVASEPILELRRSEDDLFLPRSLSEADGEYATSEPAIKLPEPTLPLLSDRQQPEATPKLADWKHEWSIFAGEAGLRASGTSTAADPSIFAESSVSGTSQPQEPAPYSVWTPTKPAPTARSHRPRTLTSSSSKPSLLPTVHEVNTPTVDIFEFMGGYSGPDEARKRSRWRMFWMSRSRPSNLVPRRRRRSRLVQRHPKFLGRLWTTIRLGDGLLRCWTQC